MTDYTKPAGAIEFKNATQTGPPPNIKVRIPDINPDRDVVIYTFVTRPESGGGMHMLNFCTADGIFATVNLEERYGTGEAFGASPFLSDVSQTIKAFVNAKIPNTSNGNDRVVFPVDSGIFAYETFGE